MAADKPQEKIVFSSDLYFGMPFYIKNDEEQCEYFLKNIKLSPGVTNSKGHHIPAVKLHLQAMDHKIWIDDFQCSTVRDEDKWQKNEDRKNRASDDDEDD